MGRPRTRARGTTPFAQWLWALIDSGHASEEQIQAWCNVARKTVLAWQSGEGPLHPDHVQQTIQQHLSREPVRDARSLVDSARAEIAALPYLPDDIKRGIDAHLAGQVNLLNMMAAKIDYLIRQVEEMQRITRPAYPEAVRDLQALEAEPERKPPPPDDPPEPIRLRPVKSIKSPAKPPRERGAR